MNIEVIKKPFKRIGAEVEVGDFVPSGRDRTPASYRIDVRKGRFQIAAMKDVDVCVVDVRPFDKHLLLNVTEPWVKHLKRKHKFLLGFDERDWFVAAIPETFTWVKNVAEAKQVLKPAAVLTAEKKLIKTSKNIRRNKAWIRQGEWFFIPTDDLHPDLKLIHRNEPVTRGNGSKPHIIDEVYRTRGELVYVSRNHPAGISEADYKKVVQREAKRKTEFRMMTRNAEVFARGRVRHSDHATIFLEGWHQVMMNTESDASSRSNLAFLD